MISPSDVILAFLAAGLLTGAYKFWRWDRSEHARIAAYRSRLGGRLDRSPEDFAYSLARAGAQLGIDLDLLARAHGDRRLIAVTEPDLDHIRAIR